MGDYQVRTVGMLVSIGVIATRSDCNFLYRLNRGGVRVELEETRDGRGIPAFGKQHYGFGATQLSAVGTAELLEPSRCDTQARGRFVKT